IWLLNGTIYSQKLAPHLDISASVYNILDKKYATPAGVQNIQNVITQDGRSFRVKVGLEF
ncbi:MAG TPA: hypothetical protein VG095_03470, partial [Chthoniobacterales bacterium]|nr:hypothetical protein [Chthoniobacterales bacterium]